MSQQSLSWGLKGCDQRSSLGQQGDTGIAVLSKVNVAPVVRGNVIDKARNTTQVAWTSVDGDVVGVEG